MPNRYSAQWFKNPLNSIDEFVLIKGDKSKLLWANQVFLDYYDMKQSDLTDMIDAKSSDPDHTLQYVKDDHYVYTNKKKLNIASETVTDHKGVIRYFHMTKNPIFYNFGEISSTIGISKQIMLSHGGT